MLVHGAVNVIASTLKLASPGGVRPVKQFHLENTRE